VSLVAAVRRAAAVAAAALAVFALGAAWGRGGCATAPRTEKGAPPGAGRSVGQDASQSAAPRTEQPGGQPGKRRPEAPSLLPADLSGRVVRVRDGDSIVVLAGGAQVEVRLDGIDCPELHQAFGKRAKQRTGELASGRDVRVEAKGRDRYGRELAEVFLPDGRSLNRELVSEGYAWWYRKYSNDADLGERESAARAARLGLWADRAAVPPWEFRAAQAGRGSGK
jgi:endonuclease YncB( thermonuclease family)